MRKRTHGSHLAQCGHWYTGTAFRPRPMCPPCTRAAADAMVAENRRRAKEHAERERRRGRFYINPRVRLAIYERDGWTCQLCQEPVDRNADPRDDWSATLDHIICQSWTEEPDHSESNLRLAHRWCNSVRGDESQWTAADLRRIA